MASFLNTKSIVSSIDTIISEAKSEIYIVSPYLKADHYGIFKLKQASKRGIPITFLYGKKGYDKNILEILSKMPNFRIAYLQPLHAKCYFNEKRMIITSLNYHEYSEQNNFEFGVLVYNSLKDSSLYQEVRKEVMDFIEEAEIKSDTRDILKDDIMAKWSCIRCGTSITKNLNRPFCHDHWEIWSIFKKIDYPEKFCHHCGEKHETTKSNPLCEKCRKFLSA